MRSGRPSSRLWNLGELGPIRRKARDPKYGPMRDPMRRADFGSKGSRQALRPVETSHESPARPSPFHSLFARVPLSIFFDLFRSLRFLSGSGFSRVTRGTVRGRSNDAARRAALGAQLTPYQSGDRPHIVAAENHISQTKTLAAAGSHTRVKTRQVWSLGFPAIECDVWAP